MPPTNGKPDQPAARAKQSAPRRPRPAKQANPDPTPTLSPLPADPTAEPTETSHSAPEAQTPSSPRRRQTAARTGAEVLSGFAGTTSRVVQRAASILEEEIAAGIVAARQVEERFLNVGELRAGKPDEVMQRFRHDSHEVVDLLMDLVSLATRSLGDFAQRMVTIRTGDRPAKAGDAGAGRVPTLQLPQTVRAGESAAVPMSMENESDSATGEFRFHSSDLVNASGERVAAHQVLFSPAVLNIGPHNAEQVVVTVVVPEGTPPGTYAGLLQATRLDQLRAVLVVQVE